MTNHTIRLAVHSAKMAIRLTADLWGNCYTATLTETFRHVAACNTDISSGGLHGAARSLLRTVWCKIAALSTLGRTPDVYVIGLSRRT